MKENDLKPFPTKNSTHFRIEPPFQQNSEFLEIKERLNQSYIEAETTTILIKKMRIKVERKQQRATLLKLIFLHPLQKSAQQKLDESQFELECLEDRLNALRVDIDIYMTDSLAEKYQQVVYNFGLLQHINQKWDITSSTPINSRYGRTKAVSEIDVLPIRIAYHHISNVDSVYPALHFQNINGSDLYFYPSFLITIDSQHHFDVINLTELKVVFEETQMLTQEQMPADSKVIGYGWAKSKKDGDRDRRYSNNYQIPLIRFGEIIINSTAGLQEKYLFSNFEVAYEFYKSFIDYQTELMNLIKPIIRNQ